MSEKRPADGILLVAEIGSTTTLVSAFAGLSGDSPALLGQEQVLTTADQGDVRVGLQAALAGLASRIGALDGSEILATSSAAGGLSVTVHGLVFDMTVRAAREAALGAGAVIRLITAGLLGPEELARVEEINPRLIMLAGGVDYGEERTVLANAHRLAGLACRAPLVYAGNVALQKRIAAICAGAARELHLLPNVYPGIDQLVVEPTRGLMHRVFEERITQAPGMEQVRSLISGRILPTPGAVMLAAAALREEIGDLMVVDVGGATTDVHSVTEGAAPLRDLATDTEPLAKRTVEGDLGIFRNAPQIAALLETAELPPAMPVQPAEVERALAFTRAAVREAVNRHAGRIKHLFTPAGRIDVLSGRDLTAIRYVIGTGGALVRLPGGEEILAWIRRCPGGEQLLPEAPRVLLDRDYLMAACGVLLERWPRGAMLLLRRSLGI